MSDKLFVNFNISFSDKITPLQFSNEYSEI
jgi:hypothetical protein